MALIRGVFIRYTSKNSSKLTLKKLYQDSHEAGRVNAVSGEGMILFSDSLHLRSLELNRLVIKNILNSSDPICAVASRVDSRLCAVGLQSGKILVPYSLLYLTFSAHRP